MAQQKIPVILSTRENESSLTDAIDRFVVALAEEVDRLQDAELDGNPELLRRLATELGDRAEHLGYRPLADIATVVANACRDAKPEDASAAMVELTEISSRIRRGHRGAA